MIKNFLFVMLFFAAHVTSQAQLTISNSSLEAWDNPTGNTAEPQNWNGIKTGTGNSTAINSAPQTLFREATNPRTGTYCARLETVSVPIVNIIAPGSMATGRFFAPSLNASEGYVATVPSNPDFNLPFIGRPDSLVFWIRYTRAGNDFPSLTALLHVGNAYQPEAPVNNNHPDSSMNIIARANWQGPSSSVSGWTRISIPFVYVDSRTPQYLLIVATPTGNSNPTNAGSRLWLDDFIVAYNPIVGAVNTSATFYVSGTAGVSIDVPFTLTGPYDAGNTVTAQLSNAIGSFANPVTIGSVNATASGTINATIPAATPSGIGHKIRVVASNPAGVSNNTSGDISVVLINAAITPASSQSILAGEDGNTLNITENYTATAREWKFSTTSGTGYQSFSSPETGSTYTPNFLNNGTYYIVVESELNALTTSSNEVQISVNTVTLTTGVIVPEFLDFSASASDTTFDVPYTTSADFNIGNIFSVQLSDASGSFANPTVIGSVAAITSGIISATIPSTTITGSYRVRVVSDDPEIFGNDNGADISVDQFSISVAPIATQNVLVNMSGNFLTVTESQNTISREWSVSTTSGSGYQPFNPAETLPSYTPLFDTQGDYYVICASTNQFNDEVISNEVLISVTISVGVDDNTKNIVSVWNNGNGITADLTSAQLSNASLIIMNLEGKEIVHTDVQSGVVNAINAELSKGIYLVKIYDNNHMFTTKVAQY